MLAAALAAHRAISRNLAEQWQRATARPARRSWVLDLVLLASPAPGSPSWPPVGCSADRIGAQHAHPAGCRAAGAGLRGTGGEDPAVPGADRAAATRRHGGIGAFLAARRLARGTGTAATLIVLVTSLGLVTFATAAWSSARTNHNEVALTQLGADTVLSSRRRLAALTDTVRRIDPAGSKP